MKIMLICNEYPPRPHGGIGTFVQTLARGLHRRGHEVTVVGMGLESEESTDEGIPVIILRKCKIRYVGNLISRLRMRRWIFSRVKAGQVDVIESPDYSGMLPFGVNGCPVVVRLHQTGTALRLDRGQKKARGIAFYERRALMANPNWIGVSHYIVDLTQRVFGVFPGRSTVIYNPVSMPPSDLPEVAGLPANYVLYAAQVSRRKGALMLAEAAREFLSRHPGLHLVYAGGEISEGRNRPISEDIREIVGPDLSKRIHFLGHVDRGVVLACMKRARVFAFPSRLEAFGLVVLEAMSCGLPVVFSKNPPGPEVIEDGITGLLADPNSPKDFSEKISRILDDPELARRLVENARRSLAERFSVGKCIEETERFYGECLDAVKSPAQTSAPELQSARTRIRN
ncbi:MAG: glycosyltransferase family 4 protein [Acidobacteriia bacterium]|nr:glycosyltransferase family 4 protein [Terriglobia bacterium]